MLKNATYNLMETASVISKGLHRYETFVRDSGECGHCKEIWNQYQEAQLIAAALCAAAALPIVGAAFVPLCVAHQMAALFFVLLYGGSCMNA